ncbi:MAG: Gfo/Idh/MocA family oxidoreductase [Pirellulales bacterium]|nr:Gfo/Idh/MocA family oxidoreductase [Pirellulales bacterium]
MSENENDNKTRRQFLKASSTAVAAGALVMGAARNAHAAGSDVLRIGLIGAGGRGTGAAIQALNTITGDNPLQLIAVGDVFEDNAQSAARNLRSKHPDHVDLPEERVFSGFDAYRKVLATECDVVILATPPGFRPIHFKAAVDAGKHVFMEKPVATDAAGVRNVVLASAVARQKNLAVAVGLQRRHEDRYRETIRRLQDGAIGDINLARVYWNGNTPWVRPRKPEQSEMEYQMRNWYFFNWLCGDHIVEQHIHNLDVINWLKDGFPVKANGMGGRLLRTGKDHGEIFDHHFIEYTYADGSKMFSQCRHMPGCWNSVSEHVQGSKGNANIGGASIQGLDGAKIWQYGRGGAGGHQREHFDLFADLRAGKIPNEGVYGAYSTMTSIMGRMCTYSGKELSWDEALNSSVELGVRDFQSFDDKPPILPDEHGHYPIAQPGLTKVV